MSLRIRVYPTSAVIATDGKVQKAIPGHLEKEEIKKLFSSKMMDDKHMMKDDMMKDKMFDNMGMAELVKMKNYDERQNG